MADLTNTVRWVPYVPDLLGNRELEKPFYFELNGSMSKEQLSAMRADLTKPSPALKPLPDDATDEQRAERGEVVRADLVQRYAAALGPYIRFGSEPLTVAGERIETLERYLDFVSGRLSGLTPFLEPSRALGEANTLGPSSSFSSGRLSGGFSSTTPPSGARGAARAAAR